ncbi:MAG: hypothetical protein ACRDMI_11425 [Streptosporangiaceae bacterium]
MEMTREVLAAKFQAVFPHLDGRQRQRRRLRLLLLLLSSAVAGRCDALFRVVS